MEDTLIKGDVILVNKLSYGPILPRSPSEIPFVNLAINLKRRTQSKYDSIWWNYKRLQGVSNFNRGDIFVFKYNRKSNFAIKRCIALPGDTLQIIDGEVNINSKLLKEASLTKYRYIASINDISSFDALCNSLGIKYFGVFKENSIELTMNKLQKDILVYSNCVDSINIKNVVAEPSGILFPYIRGNSWSITNYGPFIIPCKGMTINIQKETYGMYSQIIMKYENEDAEFAIIDDSFSQNGKEVNEYTFKSDYFFMIGDNRFNSKDSRYDGPIPEELIIGKSVMILFSIDHYGFRWDRMLKKIK